MRQVCIRERLDKDLDKMMYQTKLAITYETQKQMVSVMADVASKHGISTNFQTVNRTEETSLGQFLFYSLAQFSATKPEPIDQEPECISQSDSAHRRHRRTRVSQRSIEGTLRQAKRIYNNNKPPTPASSKGAYLQRVSTP